MAVAVSLVAAAEHPMAAVAASLAVAMAEALPMVAVEVVAHLTVVVVAAHLTVVEAAANHTAVAAVAATHTPRHWLAVTRRALRRSVSSPLPSTGVGFALTPKP
jgi:hypothetical protein